MNKGKKMTVVAVANLAIVAVTGLTIWGLKLSGVAETAVFVAGLACMGGTVVWFQKK